MMDTPTAPDVAWLEYFRGAFYVSNERMSGAEPYVPKSLLAAAISRATEAEAALLAMVRAFDNYYDGACITDDLDAALKDARAILVTTGAKT